MKSEYLLYTDGACTGNPGPGGWGFVLQMPDGKLEADSGFEPHTTNNRMEMTAALKGLERVPPHQTVHLFTDSSYLKGGLESWRHTWKKNGWKRGKERLANADLWKELDALANDREMKYTLVKGHSGNPLNEKCDALARRAIREGKGNASQGASLSKSAEQILQNAFSLDLDNRELIAALREALMFLEDKESKT